MKTTPKKKLAMPAGLKVKKPSSPGSKGLGAYYGGVKNNPALFPSTKEQ